MTFTTEELLLAAQVREIAISLRKRDSLGAIPSDSFDSREAFEAALTKWLNGNPIDQYIPEATQALIGVATRVRAIIGSPAG